MITKKNARLNEKRPSCATGLQPADPDYHHQRLPIAGQYWRRAILRVSALGCAIFFCWTETFAAIAQDTISVRDANTGKANQFKGDVLEWDARQLIFSVNGREREIPSRRVIGVVYARSDRLIEADTLMEAGKLPQALQAYENAIETNMRAWVVREIRAKRVQCACGLGQYDLALAEFLAILNSNGDTRFFHLLPLAWDNRLRLTNPIPELADWLAGIEETRSLAAASWLFQTNNQEAESRLKQLRRSTDARIAHLATAQLWRSQIVTAGPDDLRQWQTAIERMPSQLRAGPRFVLGMVLSRHAALANPVDDDLLNRTVVSLMRIPILYPEYYQLGGLALLESSQLLAAAKREEEAVAIEQELARAFRHSVAATIARQDLQNLNDQN